MTTPEPTAKMTAGGILRRSWRDARSAQWSEDKHPRGFGGRFGHSGSGRARPGPRLAPVHVDTLEEAHRLADDGVPFSYGGVLRTSDMAEAARAIAEGRHVELARPDEVATLLDKLAEMVRDAEAKGDKAPVYNLCKVSVKGTNLFCEANMGRARDTMPQFSGVPAPGSPGDNEHMFPKNPQGKVDLGPAFLQHLEAGGVDVRARTVKASHLRASQNELNGAAVAGIAKALRAGKTLKPIYVTSDGYIIDGHHTWAATVGVDSDDNRLGDLTMEVREVDMPILDALAAASEWTAAMGIKPRGVTTEKAVAIPLRPFQMDVLPGSVLAVSTPDGDAYFDVTKADGPPGLGLEVVDTADGEGGVAFDVDGRRVLWAPTAKSFGAEALRAEIVFTADADEVTFPPGFTGYPWPATDARRFLLEDVTKARLPMGAPGSAARAKFDEAKHPRGFGGKFGHGTGVAKPGRAGRRGRGGALPDPDMPKIVHNTTPRISAQDVRRHQAGLPVVAGVKKPKGAPKLGPDPTAGAGRGQLAHSEVDSLTKHGGPDGLTPERKALHDAIVASHLKGHEPPGGTPVAVFLGGGPAAGKSTVLGAAPTTGVVVDADHIKSMLPEYQQMLAAHDANAASYVHEESSHLAKRIQSEAAAAGLDFTLDGTGDSSIDKLRSKVGQARAAGHSTKGLYVTVETDEAVRRAEERGKKTGRVVPSSVIRDTHAMVSRTLPRAIAEDLFDELTLWDTSTSPLTLVGEKKAGGKWGVHDFDAWQRFVAKGDEVTKAKGPEMSGEDAVNMLRAIVDGRTFEDAGVPDTPLHRSRWDAYAGEVEQIKAAGQVVDVPYDWTTTPDDPTPDAPATPPAPTPPAPVAKAAAGPPSKVDTAKRFTFGPLYPATPTGKAVTAEDLDAHEEFVTDEDLQQSVWGYVRTGDRNIRLQHGAAERVIGEWVELSCIPAPVTVDLALPTGEVVRKSFAAGTPFMGVVWTPLGWELVRKGLIRGYSFGGSARKMVVDLEVPS